MRKLLLIGFMFFVAGCATSFDNPSSTSLVAVPVNAPAAPRVGDRSLYIVRNAYNGEVVGQIEYRVEKVDNGRSVLAVNPGSTYPAPPRTVVYAADGNWLRHPVVNHDQLIDYEFMQPFPAYVFPLETARAWSQRVNARNTITGKVHSVRVDGQVLGSERIATPAGAFDTVKIRRRIYAGDWDGFLLETNIVEMDWYSPALGRSVRLERNSTWLDQSRGAGGGGVLGIFNNNQQMRGDWLIYELSSAPAMAQRPAAAPR